MELPETKQISYRQAMQWMFGHSLRMSEIPLEHAISLPLPSRRFGIEAFVQTASPAVRLPGQAPRQLSPDRWWAFSARGGNLSAYALMGVVPLENLAAFEACELVSPAETVAALREGREAFTAAMTEAVVRFFRGDPPAAGEGARISQLIEAIVPAALIPQHRALAPDFFSWLEA